jgi:hypothetical protein
LGRDYYFIMTKCVVLHSTGRHSGAKAPILREVLLREPDLFATVGVDCHGWEDAMDELCVELDTSGEWSGAFCNTTSHPNATLVEVVAFAEQWCDLKGWSHDIEVIEV